MTIAPLVASLLFEPIKFVKNVGDNIKLIEERKRAEAENKPEMLELTKEEKDMIEARRHKRGQQSTGK